jgi:predicted alpha/beta superfamily hydrolase
MSTEPIITDPDMPVPASIKSPAAATGDLKSRLRLHSQFPSRYVDDKHDFIVYVPPMFEAEPQRRYPVLYLQDGQNLFDPNTSFIKGNYWRMGETADELIMSGAIQPLVIVGVYNTGPHRVDEYTPARDRRLGGGQADEYGRMLVKELKPFIDSNYRSLPSAENSGIGGSSLGALASLYLGLRYPRVFGKLCIMSPSVWWKQRAILKTVADLKRKPPLRIWLDIGTNESLRALPDTRALKTALVKKGWSEGQDLVYSEIEGGQHTESAWALRVAPMLQFLFPPTQ